MPTKKSKKNRLNPNLVNQSNRLGGGWINADPARIRFQHSRIRPYFSGCGRSVEKTWESIQKGEMKPEDLPPILVIVGPDEQDGKGPWYFSLNNRRLWILKRCREEGFLPGNVIRVRVRAPKSHVEYERYSIENCALEATFKREKPPIKEVMKEMQKLKAKDSDEESDQEKNKMEEEVDNNETVVMEPSPGDKPGNEQKQHEGDDESSDDGAPSTTPYRNPFDLGDDSSDSDSD